LSLRDNNCIMKNICLNFQVHQPFRLTNFPFFHIGENGEYFDEAANSSILKKVAQKCYLPANKLLLDLFHKHGNGFRVSFSISGTVLDQFERYMPEVIESFRKLADTGNVEFLSETYAHSLAALKSKDEFIWQVNTHAEKIETLFGQRPLTFRNTELVYSDFIGDIVHAMGYKVMLTEGSDWVLGWKSPNHLYTNHAHPSLRLLIKNYRLSDDIAFRFSDRNWKEWPLTTDKFTNWLNAIPEDQKIVNLFMDYETFGEHQWKETGIFDFLKEFPDKALSKHFKFITPIEVAFLADKGHLNIPTPVFWADNERDLTAWLGNYMQQDAFDTLYELEGKVIKCKNVQLKQDWLYLQASDHFYYMCTKHFSDWDVHKYFNPYKSPFDAYINYMNVLADLSLKLDLDLYHLKALPTKSNIKQEKTISV
jgi:alpha-amylase